MKAQENVAAETSQRALVAPPRAARCVPAGKFPFAFGRRFYLAFLVGLVWLGPAWFDRRYLAGMFLWDALVLILWAVDLFNLPKPAELELIRSLRMPAALSTPGHIQLELCNHGRYSVNAQVLDDAPVAVIPQPPVLNFFVRAGERAAQDYAVLPRSRGDARFGPAFVRYSSFWELAERWGRADLAQTVRVYANLDEARQHVIYLIRSRQVQLEKRLHHIRGSGREFESLREYRQGDEIRDICWTATARRASPISKVYRIERSQAVWVNLDAGRLMRARVGALAKLDYAVNATLSLAQITLHSGDRFGMIAYGRQPQQRLNASRGAGQLRAVVESLALVRGEPAEADHLRAARSLMSAQKQRSLVVWVTDLPESAAVPDVVESAMLVARRHLVLFLVIGNPELLQEAARVPADQAELYRCAAAAEMVHRREVLLGQLRQRGVLAMELEASRLTSTLVNQYLEAKERGRI